MRIAKQVLRPERLRQVPEQFSWIDQSLVQWGLIERMDAHGCALYLFLVTVADAQGLSYYGASTLAKRLHLSAQELDAARAGLIALDLIAYQAPLYQVLSGPLPHPPPVLRAPRRTTNQRATGPISLAQLIALERSHAHV